MGSDGSASAAVAVMLSLAKKAVKASLVGAKSVSVDEPLLIAKSAGELCGCSAASTNVLVSGSFPAYTTSDAFTSRTAVMTCAMPLLAPISAVATVAEPPTAGVTVIVPEALSYWMVMEEPASVVSVIVGAAIRSTEV